MEEALIHISGGHENEPIWLGGITEMEYSVLRGIASVPESVEQDVDDDYDQGEDAQEEADSGSRASRAGRIVVGPMHSGGCEITVKDRVGSISVGRFRIAVAPKIGPKHFNWVIGATKGRGLGTYFESIGGPVEVSEPSPLWEIVAEAYLAEMGRLLEGDLLRDYVELEDDLPFVRGRILALPTARNFYRGSLEFAVRYEDSSVDTPLNRILKAAVWRLLVNPALSGIRFRSLERAVLARMGGVSDVRVSDMRQAFIGDRRMLRYGHALNLAKLILTDTGLAWEEGTVRAEAHLIKTPLLIEDGVRSVLEHGLRGRWPMPPKRSFDYTFPTTMKARPDLEFGPPLRAVGDVKYRVKSLRSSSYWGDHKVSLYQAVAFAVAARVSQACVVDFTRSAVADANLTVDQGVKLGDIQVRRLVWDTTRDDPAESERLLVRQAVAWLDEALAAEKADHLATA